MERMTKSSMLPGDDPFEPVLDNDLFKAVLETVAQYAREHPNLSLAELADMVPGDGHAMVMTLRIEDLWPRTSEGTADLVDDPVPTDQRVIARVVALQRWIDDGCREAFTASEAMKALKCSRNTVLRTVAAMADISKEGNASTARYVVS